jgi:restriction system protein
MTSTRIAIFDEWWPVKYDKNHPVPTSDEPSQWSKFMDSPRLSEPSGASDGKRYFQVCDSRVLDELQRIDKFQTCPICRSGVTLRNTRVEGEKIYVCLSCGYWAGIGFREWNFNLHAEPLRGVVGRYSPVHPLNQAQTEYLVTHLRRRPKDLTKISPKRAETFVMDLLSDYLGCEVRPLGGVKDGGIDGYILKGEKLGCIVQVKWRQSEEGAEGVSVVREVAGTLLARNVPNGILVSTRSRYSRDAKSEAQLVSSRHVDGIGKLDLQLFDYQNIIDMLELSSTKLTQNMKVEDWFTVSDEICVFDGAAMLSEDFVEHMKGAA